jgi:hypothetical protein
LKKIFSLIILLLISIFQNSEAQPVSPQLYFCEQYLDGIEIGVSSTFTTGCITIVLDLRPSNEIVNVNKVYIKITKVADKDGYYPDEILIDRIPFEVSADWDYLYFENSGRLKFEEPGIYRVYCLDESGQNIANAFLKVIQK